MKIGVYTIHLKHSCIYLFIPLLAMAVLAYYMLGSQPYMDTDAMLMIKPLALLMALSLVFIIKGELVIRKIDDALSHKKEPFFASKKDCIQFLGFTLLSCLYIYAMPYAGYVIATLLFSAVAMFFLGVRSRKALFLVPVILTATIYLMFKTILTISLPIGVLGI